MVLLLLDMRVANSLCALAVILLIKRSSCSKQTKQNLDKIIHL